MKSSAVKKMIEQLYARHPTGCCLHIVTDDNNIEDSHVQFCVEEAQRSGHPSCERLAEALLEMSLEDRAALLGVHLCEKCGEPHHPQIECDD